MAGHEQIVPRAWEVCEGELAEQGFELVEVEYDHRSGGGALRLFLDREGGITLDDCQAAAQFLSPLLDKEDFVPGKFTLETSSPGISRPVRKTSDFERFAGEQIKLVALEPVQGRRRFTGTLEGFQDGLVLVDCDGEPYEIHIENVKKANLVR